MSARPGAPRLLVTTPFLRLFSLPSCPLTWSPTEQVALVVQRGRGGDGGRLRRAAAAVPPLARHARTDRRDHALCQAGCNPTHPACSPVLPTCNPVHPGLQPRAPRPAAHAPSAWPHVIAPSLRRAGAEDRDVASRARPHAGGRWRQGGRRRELPGAGARSCVPEAAALPMPACTPTSRCTPATLPVRALQQCYARLYTRSARPSSSRRCARRWASSSITIPNP